MPLYVYQCGACGGQFNSMHSIQTTVTVCALCGVEDNLRRVPQMISFGRKKSADNKKVGDVITTGGWREPFPASVCFT